MMAADRHQRAWQAAARLLKRREEELREITARWEHGQVAFETVIRLKDEVYALMEFEREVFHRAFPGPPRSGGCQSENRP
jgi:hypothetical protein